MTLEELETIGDKMFDAIKDFMQGFYESHQN